MIGTSIGKYKNTLLKVKARLEGKNEADVRGNQTFDQRTGIHVLTAIEAPLLDLWGNTWKCPSPLSSGMAW